MKDVYKWLKILSNNVVLAYKGPEKGYVKELLANRSLRVGQTKRLRRPAGRVKDP